MRSKRFVVKAVGMAYCSGCGAQLAENAGFCGRCYTARPPAADAGSRPPPSPPPAAAAAVAPAGTPVGPAISNWMMLCHLSALAGFTVPFGHIAGPLAVWLAKRAEIPQVDVEGKEALNFQISMLIYVIPLLFVSFGCFVFRLWYFAIALFMLALLIGLFQLVFTIVAAVKTSGGVPYRYPFTLRLIR